MASAKRAKRTREDMLGEFDFILKKGLEQWPQTWKEFKAEQAELIKQLMEEATQAAEDGDYCCFFGVKLRQILFRGDTRDVLKRGGFEVTDNGIKWQYKKDGRAGELCALSDSQQVPKEFHDLWWSISDSMTNRTSPGPINVRVCTPEGKALLEKILEKYPILQRTSPPEDDFCVLQLKTE